MAALGRLCVHRSDVLGALSHAEFDSQPRLRGLALEGVLAVIESIARRCHVQRVGAQYKEHIAGRWPLPVLLYIAPHGTQNFSCCLLGLQRLLQIAGE